MIQNETFKDIVHGLAHISTVEAYYNNLMKFTEENWGHPTTNACLEQIHFIEENYPIKPLERTPITPVEQPSNNTPEAVTQAVDKIIGQDFSPTDLEPVIQYVASELNWRPHDLYRYYLSRKEELEEEDFKSEITSEIRDLLTIYQQDIQLNNYLPEWLAKPIAYYCHNSKIRHSLALHALLIGVSACHPVGTRVLVDSSKNWNESPNIYGLQVSPTGQGKSPNIITFIQNPLAQIQSEWKSIFQENRRDYDDELEAIKSLPADEKKNALKDLAIPPDREKIVFATDPTVIGLNLQFNAYPNQGILGLYDEASKLFAFDRTSSRASDAADVLSYYNGNGLTELRKEGIRSNVSQTLLSIYGCIQPEKLLELMGNCDDTTGQWARFIIAIQPRQRKIPSRHLPTVDLQELLVGLYRRVLGMPKTLYLLDEDAATAFDDYLYFDVEAKRITTPSLGLAALYGKSGGKIARLAVNLHVMEMIQSDRTDQGVIRFETMLKAIQLEQFFTNQARVMFAQSMAMSGEIPAKLSMIVERSRQVGEVTARDINRSVWAFRKDDPTQIRSWFKKLEQFNQGRCTGIGNRMSFRAL